jgi:hypothetical protein
LKQLLLKLGVFLLLGVVVNVAVAWGLSLYSANLPVLRYSELPVSEAQSIWIRYGSSSLPSLPPNTSSLFVWYAPDGPVEKDGPTAKGGGRTRVHRLGIIQDVVTLSETGFTAVTRQRQVPYSERWSISEMRAGFPWSCMSMGAFQLASTGATQVTDAVVRNVSSVPQSILNDLPIPRLSVIPYRPIWPGIAINTIFFATVLWLLSVAPALIRGYLRKDAGRCPQCGYNLKENGVRRARYLLSRGCPECGWNRKAAAE